MEVFRLELPGGVTVYGTAIDHRGERHAVGHALCEAVTGSPPVLSPSGKPYVPGGPEVSISHSGRLVVCAVGPTALGVDVERERAVSQRLLARARRAGYEGGAFLPWWTAREANCKRLGRGFTWSPLPAPKNLYQGTLEHEGETYYYSVCT